jgi:hypothetical protein
MVELYRQGKLLILLPEISNNLTKSLLVVNQEELAKEIMNLALRIIFLHTSKEFLTTRGLGLYFSPKEGVCCGYLLPLNIHCTRQELNPRTLGPMARTVVITPPRTTPNDLNLDSLTVVTEFRSRYNLPLDNLLSLIYFLRLLAQNFYFRLSFPTN